MKNWWYGIKASTFLIIQKFTLHKKLNCCKVEEEEGKDEKKMRTIIYVMKKLITASLIDRHIKVND